MKAKVKFFAHLPDLVGKKEINEIDCEEGVTISKLLDWLFLDLRIKDALYDKELKIKANITILKNGREIKFLDGLETGINSGDEIAFFPLVVGGY